MAKKPAKSPLRLVPPTGTTDDAPPRTLGNHGMNLWNRITSEYEITDAGGRELLTLACQQLDRAEALKAQIDAEGEIVQSRHPPRLAPRVTGEGLRRQNSIAPWAERRATATGPRSPRRMDAARCQLNANSYAARNGSRSRLSSLSFSGTGKSLVMTSPWRKR